MICVYLFSWIYVFLKIHFSCVQTVMALHNMELARVIIFKWMYTLPSLFLSLKNINLAQDKTTKTTTVVGGWIRNACLDMVVMYA